MELKHVDALLIGGGVAAVRCARSLRRGGFSGSIAIVGEEETAPYNRPPLSKELLRDEVPQDLVLAEAPSWYERRGVELLLGTPAASLDSGERLVELADGRRLRYRHCLLATGARPRRPPIAGAEHAMLLRTLGDAIALRERAAGGSQAVIIGGGLIGVEVAASLAGRGVRVTILELGDALWSGTLGRRVSEWGMRRLAEAGVSVRLGAAVTSLAADGVSLGGEHMAADLVVAGVGVLPRVELAEASGLEVEDGIVVGEAQRTSAQGVLAAGDVARARDGVRVEHWHAAREGGERAAAQMLGTPVPARRPAWIFSEFAGAQLDVVGLAGVGDEEWDVASGVYATVRHGVVSSVVICDSAIEVAAARDLVQRGAGPADLRRLTAR